MTQQNFLTDRRSVLGALAAAPVFLAAAAPADTRLTDFIKMRGALDGRLVIGFLTGRYYGVIDAEMKPLYGLQAATFSRYAPHEDGGFRAATFEIAYFTDLDMRAVLESWRNPYTGEDVPVPVTRTDPALIYVRPSLQIELAKPYPGMAMLHHVLPAREVAGDVWVSEETIATMTVPGAARPFRYSEVVTMRARRSDLRNPRLKRVPTETSYVSSVSWRPWQRMGDRSGGLIGQGDGRIGVDIEALPALWRAETARRFPAIFADPLGPLSAALAGG